MNEFVNPDEPPIDTLIIGPETEGRQIAAVRKVRSGRDHGRVEAALERLRGAARTEENLIPLLVDCARAYATEGEIVDTLREVFGEYTEAPRF